MTVWESALTHTVVDAPWALPLAPPPASCAVIAMVSCESPYPFGLQYPSISCVLSTSFSGASLAPRGAPTRGVETGCARSGLQGSVLGINP